jgi:hypothetical protein
MEPIISPWLIYLLGIIGDSNIAWDFGFFILISLSIVSYLVLHIVPANEISNNIEFVQKIQKISRNGTIISIILFIIANLIPSKTTIIQMIVAKNITPNNLSLVIKEGKALKENIKKDVLDIIMAIGEKSNKDK